LNIPHPVLIGIFIVFIAVGVLMSYFFDVDVGPTSVSVILIVLGVIALIIWFILVVWGHVKHA
jgi:hypothetical protein